MEPVRLVVDDHAAGPENMERDLALLEEGEPTVRLYGWDPAFVSLGRSQDADVVDADALDRYDVDVVQRPTGGGAILHNPAEVTYSVVLPQDFPGHPPDIPGSFIFCSLGVLDALRELGVDAEVHTGEGGRDTLCYLREQGTNILARGRKISGGAQRRTDSHVLQHGTVVRDRDAARQAALLGSTPEAVRDGVTSLAQEGVEASREDVVEALVAGYERAWDVSLEEAPAPSVP
jgi:lipoate-protein ligase A